MKWTENQKMIAEVISKHRRENGYDLNVCLKELPDTSRGTISKVFSKLRACNWVVPLKQSNLEVNRKFPETGQQNCVGTQSVGYKTNSPGNVGIIPLSPDFRHLMKDIIVCFWCAIQLGYQGEFLLWIRDVVWDYWKMKGVDPYKILKSAGMPTDHIEDCVR